MDQQEWRGKLEPTKIPSDIYRTGKDMAKSESGERKAPFGTHKEKPGPDKGLKYYPISDLQYDIVTLVHEKSKALQAYDNYLRDGLANEELRNVFEQIRADDRKHIEMLKKYLGNC